MIGIVMAGGKGTRMKMSTEKLLLNDKKPIIQQVMEALINSDCFSKTIAITSPNSPKTQNFLVSNNFQIIDSSGLGYVEDLNSVLSQFNDLIFVCSGDMPLLDEEIIKKIISLHDDKFSWHSFLVTQDFCNSLGLNSEYSIIHNGKKCFFTGISIVNSSQISNLENIDEHFSILDDKRLAMNLNSKSDYDLLSAS